MRLSAYKKALTEASKLPNNIAELQIYFKDYYSPKGTTIQYIINKARKDDYLFHGEFIELYELSKTLRGL